MNSEVCEGKPHSVPLQAHLEAGHEIETNDLQSCATITPPQVVVE